MGDPNASIYPDQDTGMSEGVDPAPALAPPILTLVAGIPNRLRSDDNPKQHRGSAAGDRGQGDQVVVR
jgi:hypothetical protein